MVLTINFLNAFSFYMISNILSSYLVEIGIGIALAGFVVGLFSITSLFNPKISVGLIPSLSIL